MSKERKYKRELRSIEKLLRNANKQRSINKQMSEWKRYLIGGDVFYALDYCEKAKKIIDKSKVKEMHKKPHAYLAIHDGFYARGLPEGIYKDNLDIVQKVALNSFFNWFIGYSLNGSLEENISFVLNIEDPEKNQTVKERLEDLGLSIKDVLDRFEKMITREAEIIIKTHDKMEELESKGAYAFELLETFNNAMIRFEFLKKMSPNAFKFKDKNSGREINSDELYSKALNYAIHGMNVITTLLKTYPMNVPEALQPMLFSNYGLESYNFLKYFIKKYGKNYVGLIESSNGLFIPLSEKLNEDNKIIEKEMASFASFIGEIQDRRLDTAATLAKEGDPSYRVYLDEFKKFTEGYSLILEEGNSDIAPMQGICDCERHVGANYLNDSRVYDFNESNNHALYINDCRKSLPLYRVYENLNNSSLPKIILDIKKDYVKAKREKNKK